jgi:hypothetical protein
MESRKSKSRNVTGSADGTEELARDGQMEKKKKKCFSELPSAGENMKQQPLDDLLYLLSINEKTERPKCV